MNRLVVCVGILALSLSALFLGCNNATQARMDVAKKTILEQIDKAIGKMEVQKADIDRNLKTAKLAVGNLRKAKIKAQVSLEQLEEKIRPFQNSIEKIDQSLVKLRDSIKADMPATYNGKAYSVNELKDLAAKVIQSRKANEERIGSFKSARESMKKAVDATDARQQEVEIRITKFQAAISTLESEMESAVAMKQASSAMGDGNSSLSENLDELEKKIASLSSDVRVELAGQSNDWTSDSTDKAVSEVEAFINSPKVATDTLLEIDRILDGK